MPPRKKKAPREPAAPSPNARGEYRPIYAVLPDSPEFEVLSLWAGMLLYTVKVGLGASGIAVVSPADLAHKAKLTPEYGQPPEAFTAARDELVRTEWIQVEGRIWWLRNGLRFEPNLSLKNPNHRASVERFIRGLPKLAIVNRFADYYELARPFPEVPTGPSIHMGSRWDRDGISMGSPNGRNPDVENPSEPALAHAFDEHETEKASNHAGSPWDLDGMGDPTSIREPEPEPEPEPERTPTSSPTPHDEPREGGESSGESTPTPTRADLIRLAEPIARAGLNRMRGRDDEGDVQVTPKGSDRTFTVGYGLDLKRWRDLARDLKSVEPEVIARALYHAPAVLDMQPPITMALVEDTPGALAQMIHRALGETPVDAQLVATAEVKTVPIPARGPTPAEQESRARQLAQVKALTGAGDAP